MKTRILAALAAASFMTACGGDGGELDRSAGGPQPVLAEAHATGWLLVDTGPPAGVQQALTDCSDTACTVSLSGGLSQDVDLGALKQRATAAAAAARDVEDSNGIRAARLAVELDNLQFDALGVWGDYNLAATGTGTATILGAPLRFAIPVSLGQSAGTDPVSGSAMWSGRMVGVKHGNAGFGGEVRGDAEMRVDFAGANLDLDFTNIVDEASGAPGGDDMVWRDVPMRDGSFSTADGRLEGNFYGPNHEEAGGAFDRDGIAGVFSTRRQ